MDLDVLAGVQVTFSNSTFTSTENEASKKGHMHRIVTFEQSSLIGYYALRSKPHTFSMHSSLGYIMYSLLLNAKPYNFIL